MKRFWTTAEIADADSGGWRVLLDGRPVRLPDGPPLLLHHRPLATAVAEEWRQAGGEKGGEMTYADVPLTRLAGTTAERVAPDTEPVILALARYGETDLLCYRTEIPVPLAERQAAEWQPWLDWAESRYGARLLTTTSLIHLAQPAQSLAALAAAVAALDAHALGALGVAVPALGSLVLGLAMAEGELDAAAAHALAALDELYQEELWGRDEEAATRRDNIADDLATAGRFLALTRAPA